MNTMMKKRNFSKISDNEYEVDGMIDIETLDKELELELPISEGSYESLGGLIVTELSRICDGDEITIVVV